MFDTIRDYGAFACAGLLQGIGGARWAAVAYAKAHPVRTSIGASGIQHRPPTCGSPAKSATCCARAAAEKDPKRFSLAASRAKAWNGVRCGKSPRGDADFRRRQFRRRSSDPADVSGGVTLGSHYEAAHEHRARLAAGCWVGRWILPSQPKNKRFAPRSAPLPSANGDRQRQWRPRSSRPREEAAFRRRCAKPAM